LPARNGGKPPKQNQGRKQKYKENFMPTKSPFEISFVPYNSTSIEIKADLSKDAWAEMMFGKPKNKSVERITIPAIKRIVYHDPATIVFWQDGTKTVVKCMDGEPFEKYAGFCAALAKKVFGSTSKAKKVAGAKKKDEVEE
jgi:hypothetical protein